MDLLILGGTRFLGRHLVESALGRGHRVTLFNRGVSGPGLFPDVEELRGERGGGLSALRGRRWDAAIDTSGHGKFFLHTFPSYSPKLVGAGFVRRVTLGIPRRETISPAEAAALTRGL